MLKFKNVYIDDYFTVVGPVESKSKLKKFDVCINDLYYGEKTHEKAEVKMQKTVINALKKDVELIVGADLNNQLGASSMAVKNTNIPFMGVYSACASSISGLITLALNIELDNIKHGLFVTSSHNLVAEKTFRYPVEYGAYKPKYSTYTLTGAVGVKLTNKKTNIKLINGLIGCVYDSKIKDASNMGGVMAISVYNTLKRYLEQTNTMACDYDLILSGDLGLCGERVIKDLLKRDKIKGNYMDAGASIYNNKCYSGASGPVALPLYFLANVLGCKKYKKVLLIGSGSLHNTLIVNQKNSIPSTAHALLIEVSYDN